jgi:hydrogenase-4 component F
MAKVLPVSGILWMGGFLAITGSPPFGVFMSEFTIFRAAIHQGHIAVGVTYLAFLAIIFVGMARIVLRMTQGAAPSQFPVVPVRESLLTVVPPAVLGGIVLLLGLYVPTPLHRLLLEAARTLGGL